MRHQPSRLRIGMRTVSVGFVLGLAPLGLVGCSSGSDSATVATDAAATESAAVATDAAVATAPDIRLVTVDEAETLAAEPSISVIDVRTPAEFAEGHLAGASLIDFQGADFQQQLGTLDPNGRYLVYCHSGNRSGQAVQVMKALGFTDVADMDGGIAAWTENGKPVTG